MLLSGKGKHRRPSKATRMATLAGVTGAAIAAPLMVSGTASAATASEWDTVAQCESGGNWSINTGNGYYGGLQFSASTWAGYGGTKYAATADQASKAQQIEIAEKVLAGQGKGAWPVCGKGLSSAGYTGGGSSDSGAAQENTQQSQQQSAPAQEERASAPRTARLPRRPSPPRPARRSRRATASTRSSRVTPSARLPRRRRSRAAGRSCTS